MIDTAHLSSKEVGILRGHIKKSRQPLVRERAQAIIAFNKGFSTLQVSEFLEHSEKTVRDWIRTYQEKGLSSIFPRYKGGNASKLSEEQRNEIAKRLKAPPDSEDGIPRQFWDVKTLKEYVLAEFGVEYKSPESYRLLFRISNFTLHRPMKFDARRNPIKIAETMAKIKKEVDKRWKNKKWIIYTADEVRLVWEAITRRVWFPKGQVPILSVKRSDKYQHFVGFLSLKDGEERLFKLSWQNSVQVRKSLNKIKKLNPDKKILIIWDNAGFHKGKVIKNWLRRNSNFFLMNFPPYSPDYNPQEHVWKYGKDETANMQFSSFRKLITQFEIITTGRKYHFKLRRN